MDGAQTVTEFLQLITNGGTLDEALEIFERVKALLPPEKQDMTFDQFMKSLSVVLSHQCVVALEEVGQSQDAIDTAKRINQRLSSWDGRDVPLGLSEETVLLKEQMGEADV